MGFFSRTMAQLKEKNDDDDNAKQQKEVGKIDCNSLAEWIENNQGNKNDQNNKFYIVDVRDNDYGPYKIIGSVNIPKYKLIDDDKVRRVITKLIEKTKNIPNIIFHCRYSMVRGP